MFRVHQVTEPLPVLQVLVVPSGHDQLGSVSVIELELPLGVATLAL
jgi:hypothetical protein